MTPRARSIGVGGKFVGSWWGSAIVSTVDDKRLTEVEARYAFLERLVEELSHVLHQQQRTIDAMLSRLDRIETLLDRAFDEFGERLPHEKPPHY